MKNEAGLKTSLIFSVQRIVFQSKECHVLTIRDTSLVLKIGRLSSESNYTTKLTQTITKEMMFPLNCILTLSLVLLGKLQGETR
jgi:hypothetical protein